MGWFLLNFVSSFSWVAKNKKYSKIQKVVTKCKIYNCKNTSLKHSKSNKVLIGGQCLILRIKGAGFGMYEASWWVKVTLVQLKSDKIIN